MVRARNALRLVLPDREWIDMAGQRVNRAFSLRNSDDRVVLFSWAADPRPLRRNVVRVDRHGNVVWRAALPGLAVRDCFVSLERDGEFFVAGTYSRWSVRLDSDGSVRDARPAA